MTKKGKGVFGDKELMLKERFIDGILDKQLRREMRRFSLEHPTAPFQEFRTVVFKWVQDQKPGVELHQNSEHVELQAEQCSQKVDQPQDLMKMLSAQQELLEAQQKQINLLTDLVQKTGQPNPFTGFRDPGGRGGGQFYNRRPRFRGRGTPRGRIPNQLVCFNCQGEETVQGELLVLLGMKFQTTI